MAGAYGSGYIYKRKRTKVKEIFRELGKHIARKSKSIRSPKFLDIGCASGDLIEHLSQVLPTAQLTGLDYEKKLVALARSRKIPRAEFLAGDAETFRLPQKFDLITMIGVLSIFDEFEPAAKNLLRHLSPGGTAFIVSAFNEDDIDVRLKFRNNAYSKKWQTGYNIFPVASVKKFFEKKGCRVRVHTHIMPFPLKKQIDPLRAWTLETKNGRVLNNGLMMIYNLKIVEIQKRAP